MRFASGMRAIDHVPGYAIQIFPKVYDWASLRDAFIVNVSGSRGQATIELANTFGNVKLLIQASAMIIEGAKSDVRDQLKGRVKSMKYKLFEPQTVQADIYFLRIVFRN